MIDWRQLDKQAHGWMGLAVSAVVFVLAREAAGLTLAWALAAGVAAAVLVGWAKERLWDWNRRAFHTVDSQDMWATWWGCVPLVALVLALALAGWRWR